MPITRKFLFSVSLLFLVAICWRLFTAPHNQPPSIPYNDFLQDIEARKLQKATIYFGTELVNLQLTATDSTNQYVNDVPTKNLPDLIKKMKDNGISVEFATALRFDWGEFLLNIVPIALLFGMAGYIYFLRRRKLA